MRKSNLTQFKTIDAASMGASITSAVTNIEFLDNIGIEVELTSASSANGTVAVQASNSYSQDNNGNVLSAGSWTTLTSQVVASGSPSSILFALNQVPFSWIRTIYTRTSGTGTMTAYLSAKMV